jgi:D-arabinose 1-dehydrogenase-like Zn-dependent alcohol dehydrogenase
MREHFEVFTVIGLGLGLAMAFVQGAVAQQNPVTAIEGSEQEQCEIVR